MANYATLKAAIQQVVKTNGNNEITGALLQQSLLTMINSLGADYQFVGVAQPLTNPGTPDQNVFYLAGPGVYPNFGNVRVNTGEIRAFKWNGAWDTTESLIVGSMDGYQFGGVVTPESSVPTSDAKLFFVACTEGEYNFVDGVGDRIEVAEGEVAIIYGQRPLWTKAVVAPSKWLTLVNDVPSFGYDESDPVTLAEQMGHSIEDVLAKGFVVYNDDVTTNHYIVVGDYGAEGGYITFIGRDKVYQYNVDANGYITDTKVTSLAPDDELSDTSENAVQNKVVKAAFDAKQNKDTNAIAGNVAVMDANGNSKGSNVPIDNVAKIDGQYDTLTSGYAGNLIDKSDAGSEQQIMFRKTGGTTEVAESTRAMFKRLLGRSLVWNQLLTSEPRSVTGNGVTFTQNANGSVTLSGTATATALYAIFGTGENPLIAGHQYILRGGHADDGVNSCMLAINENASYTAIASPSSMFPVVSGRLYALYIRVAAGTNVDGVVYWPQLTDLTVMYGAGYEPASVAEFEAVYNKPYYPHCTATFIHNVAQTYEAIGLNQWDEEVILGYYRATDGVYVYNATRLCSKNMTKVIPGQTYYVKAPRNIYVQEYDANKNYIGIAIQGRDTAFSFSPNAHYCHIGIFPEYGTVYNHDICINLSNADINGTYKPYEKVSATLGLSAFRVKDGQGNIRTIHGLKGTGAVYDEIDTEGKKFIERMEMRAYQSGDDSDTSVLTDGTNTLAPLAEPVVYDLVDDMPEYSQVWGVGTENILPEGVDENGVPKTTPLRAVIYYPKDYTGIINNLPKNYISTASLTNMLNALKSAGVIRSFTMTWNAETQTYNFTIS